MPSLVDVYPYCSEQDAIYFLLLKRAAAKQYAGQWRMVGGKVQECEAAWQAGLRELREETGMFPATYWTVPSINQFYDHQHDTIWHIPVFAAEVSVKEEIRLNEEHTEFKWIESGQVGNFIHWPEQQRLITLINNILTTQNILDEWKIAL